MSDNFLGFAEEKEEFMVCEDNRTPSVVSHEFSFEDVLDKLKKMTEEESAEIYVHTIRKTWSCSARYLYIISAYFCLYSNGFSSFNMV